MTTSIPGTGLSFTQGLGNGQGAPAPAQPETRHGSRVFWLLVLFLAAIGVFMLVSVGT